MRQVQRLFGAREEKIPAVALTAYGRLEDRKRGRAVVAPGGLLK